MLLGSCILLFLSSRVLAAPRIPPECSSDCMSPGRPPMTIMVVGGVMAGPEFGTPMNVPILMLPPLMMGMFGMGGGMGGGGRGGGGGGRGGGGGIGGGGGDPIMELKRPTKKVTQKKVTQKKPHRRMIGNSEAEEEFVGIQRPRTIDKTGH